MARPVRRVVGELRQRWALLAALWRRSLQLRVVVSTLALSSAVVFVLGMVLQVQIADRLLASKKDAAISQSQSSAAVVERELAGVDPSSDNLEGRLVSALNKLTSSSSKQDMSSSAAGAFEPVLADGAAEGVGSKRPFAGPYGDVPADLRQPVEKGTVTDKIYTVQGQVRTTFLEVGVPVRTATRSLQLYLLFPLTAEKSTIELVQSTLVAAGIMLLLLLAGIANLVTRQVVRPVRQGAEIAGRFAEGHLDERMPVVGEDDVAKLATSFNSMAGSIQQQIRQLEEFGQLQRRFTSDVSHELRTPLTTVRMAADVLHASREQFPFGLARSSELLVDELDRFESLLADLLEISRLDAGVAELAAETVDIRGIVRPAVNAVRAIAESAGSRVELRLPEKEVFVELDSRRVERILRNLLANAVDHGEGRPVVLTMEADEQAVAVTVRDFGVGLRPGEVDLIFTRFWRADPSRNRRSGGTGLGLSISLEDARLHGGWLDAWGEPGRGACFRLTLPRQQDAELHGSPLPLPPVESDLDGYLPDVPAGQAVVDKPEEVAVRWQPAQSITEPVVEPPTEPVRYAPSMAHVEAGQSRSESL
jgi:two-component system sensor histidine kinase MtrB